MDIDISIIKEKENSLVYGIFFSYTNLEDAYDGVHSYEVPKDLKEEVQKMSKKARSGELSWEALEAFLEQHKIA